MSFVPLLTLAGAVLLGVVILRTARANIRGDYTREPSSGRLDEEDAQPDSPALSRQMSRRDVMLLTGGLVALVILVLMSHYFWYMTASVPHQVLEQAYAEMPSWMGVMERQEAVSPLHWRVILLGHGEGDVPSTPTHTFIYSVNRLTGTESTTLKVGGGGVPGTLVLLALGCALGFGIYWGVSYLAAKPCPHCGVRPFKLTDENTLIPAQLDLDGNSLPMVNEGHFHCDRCGFNQVQVYTGTRFSHGGSGPAEAPDILDPGSRYIDGVGPGHRQVSTDDESWREQIERFRQEREREWMDGED